MCVCVCFVLFLSLLFFFGVVLVCCVVVFCAVVVLSFWYTFVVSNVLWSVPKSESDFRCTEKADLY